jgi:serine/threonine-protein kinase RsbW
MYHTGPPDTRYSPAAMRVLVPASMVGVRAAAEAFDRFAAARGVHPDVVKSVQVALDEVLSNTVRHGHGDRAPGHLVDVRFRLVEGVVEVTISDDAPAFDPLAAPPPDTTASLPARAAGGLGILLTRKLMDEVEYARADGRNRLVLRKRNVAAQAREAGAAGKREGP